MADELRIVLDPFLSTGLTLLGKVYGSDGLQEGSDVSMTEDSTGIYTGDFSLAAVSDGAYMVSFETSTAFYGSGVLYVRNNLEVKLYQLEIKSEADTRQTALIVEHDATQASIAALNDFDPASDTVAHVTLVDTTTTNTDMRGTDSAITSLAGIATATNVTDAQTAIIAEIDVNETKIDLLETKMQADTRQSALIAEHDATQTDIAALASTLAASDVQIAAIKERTDNLPDLPASKFDAIIGANA